MFKKILNKIIQYFIYYEYPGYEETGIKYEEWIKLNKNMKFDFIGLALLLIFIIFSLALLFIVFFVGVNPGA